MKARSSAHIAVLALALAMFFSAAAANAYTSTGADGAFQPPSTLALDPAQQVFNFTDIFIPGGVTVSFGGLTSAQPILLLATGNINIAGTFDAGANSLWIETPGSISVTGSLNFTGGELTLVSGGTFELSGGINASRINLALVGVPARAGVLSSRTYSKMDTLSTSGGDLTLVSGGGNVSGIANYTSGGNITLSSAGGTLVVSGGITNTGGILSGGGVTLLSPIPETEIWVMLSLGFCALFAATRRRYANTSAV